MKTMKAGAVVLLGLVLAAPAWGWGSVRFDVDPNDPLRCEVEIWLSGDPRLLQGGSRLMYGGYM